MPDPHDSSLPPLGVIDALLDGEAVDKATLRTVLDDASARDYLVDALALRQLARDMAPLRYTAPAMPARPIARAMRWAAAVVVLAACGVGGYKWGQQTAPARTASVEAFTMPASGPVAPEPTKVIQLRPGVNWTDNTGGSR